MPPVVEIVDRGGAVGQIARLGFEEQPVTAFGDMRRAETYGRRVVWFLTRLGLPPTAAKQLFDNALLRRSIYRASAYRDELLCMRQLVMDGVGADAGAPPARGMLC